MEKRSLILIIVFSLFISGCAIQDNFIQPVIEEFPETQPGQLSYVLRGESGIIEIELDSELNNYLSRLPREYYCSPICPPENQLQLRFLDEKKQNQILMDLVNKIKLITNEPKDQVRVAVSLVQRIPYDTETAYSSNYNYQTKRPVRYPYEVIYDNQGICEEKSRLLAFILREFGYDIVLFGFDNENHMSVGIKCEKQYSYRNTGYCYIETTSPSIITEKITLLDIDGEFIDILSRPRIIEINKGNSFDVLEEYQDALEWNRISKMGQVGSADYHIGIELKNKYGI